MRYRYYLILFVAFLAIQCTSEPQIIDEVAIIPKPTELVQTQGEFVFDDSISVTIEDEFLSTSSYLVKLQYQV